MSQQSLDTSYNSEDSAREKAVELSKSNHSPWYIILTGGLYFITNTKNVQSYEQVIACYIFGENQQIKRRGF